MGASTRGTSGYTQEVIAINDFGVERRERTKKSTGVKKDRYTVTITSSPILHAFDDEAIGRGPATAIADHLRSAVKGITARASDLTRRRRIGARKALAEGKAWAVKRYSGGRMGVLPPTDSIRLWNDSGRFADSIIAMRNKLEGGFTINVAANRFDPSTFGGEAGMLAAINQLRELVPEFFSAEKLAQIPAVARAVNASINAMIRSAKDRGDMLEWERLRALAGLGRSLMGGVQTTILG